MHSVEPHHPALTAPPEMEALVAQTIPIATDLIVQVRDLDQAAIAELINRRSPLEMAGLAVTLAAMVPDDVPVADLLAWTRQVFNLADLKRCQHCRQEKPVEAFSKDRSRWDGRRHTCRRCHSQMRRAAA